MNETLTFERLIYGGDALARSTSGAVVFVSGAIPGEEAQVKITETKSSYWRGEIVELLKASPHRITPPCPYVTRCGGCQWQHIDYPHQVEWKGKILEEQLWRAGLLKNIKPEPPLPSLSPFNYRARIQLKVQKTGKGFVLGYYGAKSHHLVDIEQCLIAHPALNKAIKAVRAALLGMVLPEKVFTLELTYGKVENAVLASLSWEGSLKVLTALGKGLAARVSGLVRPLAGLVVFREEAGVIKEWKKISGQSWISQRAGDYTFRQSFGSFFQVNISAWDVLLKLVEAQWDKPSWRAVDLYCGVGFFTLPLAQSFQQVWALEINPLSWVDAAQNILKAGRENIQLHRDTAENWGKYLDSGAGVDLIFLDPPRTGLSGKVMEAITKIGPSRLLYLACNPSTLTRDLGKILTQKNQKYAIEEVYSLDLFPQTYHIEALVSMKYKG